jgi:hypothetical protein
MMGSTPSVSAKNSPTINAKLPISGIISKLSGII